MLESDWFSELSGFPPSPRAPRRGLDRHCRRLLLGLLGALLCATGRSYGGGEDPLETFLRRYGGPETLGHEEERPLLRLVVEPLSSLRLGHPFVLDARVEAPRHTLEDVQLALSVPPGMRWTTGPPSSGFRLRGGESRTLRYVLQPVEPIPVLDGQLSLRAEATLASSTRLAPGEPRRVRQQATLELAVDWREGFTEFSPLVWATYLGGDGFFLGGGAYMDTHVDLQDQVLDAQKLVAQGRWAEAAPLARAALEALKEATRIDPVLKWEAWNTAALIHFFQNRHDAALAIWGRLAQSSSAGEMRRYALYNLGEAHRRRGDFESAQRAFSAAAAAKEAFVLPLRKLRSLQASPRPNR